MQTRLSTLPIQLQKIDLYLILSRITIVETTVNGFCNFIAQCTLVCLNH